MERDGGGLKTPRRINYTKTRDNGGYHGSVSVGGGGIRENGQNKHCVTMFWLFSKAILLQHDGDDGQKIK